MPESATLKRAEKDRRQGKAPSTQAGEFVREEIHHIREGKHGARSTKQAVAIGLSKARRAGVKLPPPRKGSGPVRRKAAQELARGSGNGAATKSKSRSRATLRALRREGKRAASSRALSRHARQSAAKRSSQARSAAARKAARTRHAMM